MKRFGLALGLTALAVVLVTGCRKHHRRHGHGGDDKGAPEAFWPASQMTVNEGSTFVVTLTLDQVWDAPVVITLSSTDSSRVTMPATVTFPTGATTANVSITTFADADTSDTLVQVRAESLLDINLMGLILRETSTSIGGALGPVAVGPNRAVLVTDGPDGIWGTSDDTLAVASGVGSGSPALTHVTIGAVTPGPHALPVVTGVSDTVLVQTNGPDLTLGTLDDTLVEIDGISTATPAISATVVVGRMEASEGRRPVMVGTTAVFLARGADLITNLDDQLMMAAGVGTGTLTLTTFPAPGVAFDAPSIVVMFDATSLALHLAGADLIVGTPDDVLQVLTGIPAAPTAVISAPIELFPGRMGIPIAVNSTTMAYFGTGFDFTPGTADDGVAVIQDLFGAPVASVAIIGPIMTDPDSHAVATSGDSLVIPMRGADLINFTADDEVVFFAAVSTVALGVPTVLPADNPAPGIHGRLVAAGPNEVVRITTGADAMLGTADDGVRLLTNLGGAGASSTLVTGSLQAAAPLAEAAGSVVLAGEGIDSTSGTTDDVVLEVSGIGAAVALDSAFPGPFRLSGPGAVVPNGASFVLLARTAGADGAPGTSDDILSTGSIP